MANQAVKSGTLRIAAFRGRNIAPAAPEDYEVYWNIPASELRMWDPVGLQWVALGTAPVTNPPASGGTPYPAINLYPGLTVYPSPGA